MIKKITVSGASSHCCVNIYTAVFFAIITRILDHDIFKNLFKIAEVVLRTVSKLRGKKIDNFEN